MFVQVIEAKAKDPAGLKQRMKVWERDVGPNAVGFLGSTAGVGTDGTFIAAARFESPEAAQKNSDLAEQSAWWEETSKLLDDVKFYDCEDVDVFMGGGSNDAGFVQVIQAYATDKAKLREMGEQMDDMSDQRPDVIGGFVAWGPDDGFSQFVYFTSEAEAREGEKKDEGVNAEEFQGLMRDVRFIDLTDPWMT